MDQTIVQYFNGQSARPVPARILLFNNAIQLYDIVDNNFLADFPFNGIRLLSNSGDAVHFSLVSDGSQTLQIPRHHLMLPELMKYESGDSDRWFEGLSKIKLPLLLGLFLLVVIGGYYLLVSGLSGIGLQLISPRKEAELGKLVYEAMIKDQTIHQDATQALADFSTSLDLSENYDLQFTVVDDTMVNAFAIPGGHIVVYKGILQKMQRPEELVALLGHEASHVNERHSLRNMLQELTGSFMLSMVFGDLGSIGGAVASQANMLRSLSYSRSLEESADEEGMKRMVKNNVHPEGMVMLMDRLKEASEGIELPGFLSTHPLTEDRKQHAQEFARKHSIKRDLPPVLITNWDILKRSIEKASIPQPDKAQW